MPKGHLLKAGERNGKENRKILSDTEKSDKETFSTDWRLKIKSYLYWVSCGKK